MHRTPERAFDDDHSGPNTGDKGPVASQDVGSLPPSYHSSPSSASSLLTCSHRTPRHINPHLLPLSYPSRSVVLIFTTSQALSSQLQPAAMASSFPPSLLLVLLALAGPFFLPHADAAAGGGAPAASPQPSDLIGILVKGGQFSALIRLLNETQVGTQIKNQLNDSYGGLTIFAPTDNAFNNLKTGALNDLSTQNQVSLVLFHVLPRYYSFDMFQTVSNPVRTQASDDTLNITSTTNQANVSTGVDETRINTALYETFPLAVYPVDSVLLPYSLFGAKPPASAPSTAPAKSPKAPSTPAAGPGTAAATTSSPSAASHEGRRAGWGLIMVGVAGLVSLGLLW
ncbi:hypothetical protein Taro_036379 [Colocasia esculenta]|uniref:FAS1 domain-containing protein n=1 Tax=Colocasia esculenta TaxID=4460 RepID=A0A843W2Y7_COLES|nr:hypothetical protein [Colocasia esculenta]